MSLVIGLTGGIASGKSTVAKMFVDLDIPVIDADVIAREVVEPGEEPYNQVVRAFGEEILNPDGSINRPKLGSIIFTNEEKREQLNQIVHPAVRKRMLKKKEDYIEQGEKCIVLDIPLLFESKLTSLADKTLVVFVDEKTQLKRLMERNKLSEQEALNRIESQMPLKEKAKLADELIDNNHTVEESKKQLLYLLKKWSVIE
ncbi:dephospho-CoA kinase [Oceanobacillus neutriphilus]|uniref:Dephospho-CoA kinase n=1 Tax=Oceanobacillus neutriphilus TaxID=531815 RepID=A0ABQ2NY23_9BACI|nr:dephospho-CoA kinase [Oceanobacillus neutriphilus]GGP13332.1 dephospho-CoA kinase [Oceanobacillus neutriphilus]